MMKLTDLRWDNPNNGALSLTFLAEMMRRGEIRVAGKIEERDKSDVLILEVPHGRP